MATNAVQETAEARKKLIIAAFSEELDPLNERSSARVLADMIKSGEPRPILTSGDIDGLLSAAMLSSVSARVGSTDGRWEVVAITLSTPEGQAILTHPAVAAERPPNIFGVDVFSTEFDNVSNHIVLFGDRRLSVDQVREAFEDWDAAVRAAAASPDRLIADPNLWAEIYASRNDGAYPHGAPYKYPLGTAQILLALLEAGEVAPRFFDGHYLPWLLANCDGGVASYTSKYFPNVSLWWSLMAGAVGPGSLTQMIYERVRTMLPHDFSNAVHQLSREQSAQSRAHHLDDTWNITPKTAVAMATVFDLIEQLTGWGDPVRDGTAGIVDWVLIPETDGIKVPLARGKMVAEATASGMTLADVANSIRQAVSGATNANFYMGGQSGDRFNWFGGW